jgi:hypothetical protein
MVVDRLVDIKSLLPISLFDTPSFNSCNTSISLPVKCAGMDRVFLLRPRGIFIIPEFLISNLSLLHTASAPNFCIIEIASLLSSHLLQIAEGKEDRRSLVSLVLLQCDSILAIGRVFICDRFQKLGSFG